MSEPEAKRQKSEQGPSERALREPARQSESDQEEREMKEVQQELDQVRAKHLPGSGPLSTPWSARGTQHLTPCMHSQINDEASERVLDVEREYNKKRRPVFEKRHAICSKVRRVVSPALKPISCHWRGYNFVHACAPGIIRLQMCSEAHACGCASPRCRSISFGRMC